METTPIFFSRKNYGDIVRKEKETVESHNCASPKRLWHLKRNLYDCGIIIGGSISLGTYVNMGYSGGGGIEAV